MINEYLPIAPECRDDRCITTYTGKPFWPLEPEGCEIDIDDIAHGLANNNRFNGHTLVPYSVAQHSCLVAWNVPKEFALYGLLHDAPEAFLHDIVRPIKKSVYVDGRPYDEAEDRLLRVILAKYGLAWPVPDVVWKWDNILLCTERRDLMVVNHSNPWHYPTGVDPLPETISAWHWTVARDQFRRTFDELTKTA